MNTLRIRPSPLGLVLAAPSRWAAAAQTVPACRPRQFAQQFSSSPCSLYAASKTSPSSSSPSSQNGVPTPIPLVPDVATFLSVIGRNMKQHTAKFPSWEALFTLTSAQLRELGIEPPRDRRYLIRWLQRYREGRFGIGGDFQFVRGGVAELRVHEAVDAEDPVLVYKSVLNVPVAAEAAAVEGEGEGGEEAEGAKGEGEAATGATDSADAAAAETADYDLNAPPVRVRGYKVVGAKAIAGPFALPLKQGAGSRVTVTEGMWEDKRGRKIDGGERRRAEIRFKRRAVERRAEREKLGV